MRLKVGVDIFCRTETGTEKGFSKKSTDDKIAVSGFEKSINLFLFSVASNSFDRDRSVVLAASDR